MCGIITKFPRITLPVAWPAPIRSRPQHTTCKYFGLNERERERGFENRFSKRDMARKGRWEPIVRLPFGRLVQGPKTVRSSTFVDLKDESPSSLMDGQYKYLQTKTLKWTLRKHFKTSTNEVFLKQSLWLSLTFSLHFLNKPMVGSRFAAKKFRSGRISNLYTGIVITSWPPAAGTGTYIL